MTTNTTSPNFVLVKTLRLPLSKVPPHRLRLETLLVRLGVVRKQSRVTGKPVSLEKENLWDIYDAAKKLWMQLIRQHHPDKGGDTTFCGYINSLWLEIRKRYATRFKIGEFAR